MCRWWINLGLAWENNGDLMICLALSLFPLNKELDTTIVGKRGNDTRKNFHAGTRRPRVLEAREREVGL